MGCQVSRDGNEFEPSEFDNVWKRMNANQNVQANRKVPPNSKKSADWQILRIVLVSTYKDFKNERNAMRDLIQNKLQNYASEKKIFLQLEDFSFGSQASNFEDSSSLYLIERCSRTASKDSNYIYVHFLGECSGFIIDTSFGDSQFLRQHRISYGQSLTEVFLQLAGLHHSKSLFLHRNPGFMQELPFNVSAFVDHPKNRERAIYLANMIKNSVSSTKIIEYSVRTSGINNTHFKQILFDDLSSAISPIQKLIYDYIDDVPYPDEKGIAVEDRIMQFYKTNGASSYLQNALKKVQSNMKQGKSSLIIGDYCTGKTTILHLLRPSVRIVRGRQGLGPMEFRKEIDSKLQININEKTDNILLIDDIHLLSKETLEILTNYTLLTIIATSRKKKITYQGFVETVLIESLSSEDVSELLAEWIDGDENSGSVKSSNILKISQQKRRKSIGSIEDGAVKKVDENQGWNVLKCQVIGSLARLGNSEEKCAQLAQLSTIR